MPRRVAIVTDSTADLAPDVAAARGITVVPLFVTFGTEEFRAGVDLSTAAFWERMLAPDAPFPTTAAAAPGTFRDVFGEAFAQGAVGIVCVTIGAKLSATFKSAELGAQMLPDREIHVIDSTTASLGLGMLALLAADLADEGRSAAEIAGLIRERTRDVDLYVALDTLEYLRKGGRLSAARAAIGTVLSTKPIITIRNGEVETADKPRTRARARERVLELVTRRPADWIAILYTPGEGTDPDAFRADVLARIPGDVDPAHVMTGVVGASVGPHIGPRCLGAVMILARS